MRIAEGRILCKLCLCRWNKFVAVFNVMRIVNCEAAALLEEGNQNFAVNADAVFLHSFPENFGFQRKVSAQRRIAAGDERIGRVIGYFICSRLGIGEDLTMNTRRLILCHAAAVGQNIENAAVFFEPLTDRVNVPVRIDMDVMNRLNPGGIIVEDDELFMIG